MSIRTHYANRPSTVFGWLVDQETRLHRALQLMVLRRALRAAYARFAAGNRELSESLFDAHFVETRVAPLLARALEADHRLTADVVAEAWFGGCKAPGASSAGRNLSAIRAAAVELLSHLERELHPEVEQVAVQPEAMQDAVAAALFAEAVRVNSNLELDWLWLYTRMTGAYERSYCLQKALHINPESALARRELAALEARGMYAALVPAPEV